MKRVGWNGSTKELSDLMGIFEMSEWQLHSCSKLSKIIERNI